MVIPKIMFSKHSRSQDHINLLNIIWILTQEWKIRLDMAKTINKLWYNRILIVIQWHINRWQVSNKITSSNGIRISMECQVGISSTISMGWCKIRWIHMGEWHHLVWWECLVVDRACMVVDYKVVLVKVVWIKWCMVDKCKCRIKWWWTKKVVVNLIKVEVINLENKIKIISDKETNKIKLEEEVFLEINKISRCNKCRLSNCQKVNFWRI